MQHRLNENHSNGSGNMGVQVRGYQSSGATFLPASKKGWPAFNLLFCVFLYRDVQVRAL
jgi:hypothetical protein